MINSILYKKPSCIKRLGEEIFIKLPLYKANILYEPIYINEKLFQEYFNKNISFAEQVEIIKETFSVTLQSIKSTGEQCGYAYVDRQAEDSYQSSLGGNQGSGRAYYTGGCFNIKGEKTPLATSVNPIMSNGILSLGHGIWSAFIGNSLEDELHVKPSQVLAILRVDSDSCKIIRIDNGALDRITHLLYLPRKLSITKLHATAKQLGHLEAEKFIHRILHGAWSAGNTSLQGHLIDYDSICVVKGRQPQYSFTPYFPDNYFGFESMGQLKVLQNIWEHPVLNQVNVPWIVPNDRADKAHPANKPKFHNSSGLVNIFEKSFKYHINKGLIYLMGFKDNLGKKFDDSRKRLAESFFELSHYTYYISEQSLCANYPSSLFFHVYDFSAFFRIYPLLKLANKFDPLLSVDIMMNSHLQHKMIEIDYEEKAEALAPQVYTVFKNYLFTCNTSSRKILEQQALEFVTQYDELFTRLLKECKNDLQEIAARAYVINEDRFYLFAVFSVEKLLTHYQSKYSAYDLHRYINQFICASKRNPELDYDDNYLADMRVFEEGYLHILLNTNGSYCVVIHLYLDKLPQEYSAHAKWSIQILNKFFPAICDIDTDMMHIRSAPIPNLQLLENYHRDAVFLLNQYILYCEGQKIKLTDFFFPEEEKGYYFSYPH